MIYGDELGNLESRSVRDRYSAFTDFTRNIINVAENEMEEVQLRPRGLVLFVTLAAFRRIRIWVIYDLVIWSILVPRIKG